MDPEDRGWMGCFALSWIESPPGPGHPGASSSLLRPHFGDFVRFTWPARMGTHPSRGMKGGTHGWRTCTLWGPDPVPSLPTVDPLSWGSPPKRSVSGSARMLQPDYHHEGGGRGYVGIDAHTRDCHASYAPSADPWTLVPGSSPRRGGNDTSRSLLLIACGAALAGRGGRGGTRRPSPQRESRGSHGLPSRQRVLAHAVSYLRQIRTKTLAAASSGTDPRIH